MKSWKFAALAGPLLLQAPVAQAETFVIGPGFSTLLTISFSMPAQHPDHSAIWFVSGSISTGSISTETSLYDDTGLVGRGTATDSFPWLVFADPSNFKYGEPGSVTIDFSRLAGGVTAGRLEVRVTGGTPGAWMSLESEHIMGLPFGNMGGFAAYNAVITGVTTSAVPEPTPALMLAAGLALGAWLRRGRGTAACA